MATSSTTDYIASRLANYNAAAEGSTLPPRQRGEQRVPLASGLKVIAVTPGISSTTYTLGWTDVNIGANVNVDHYNIYYTLASASTNQVGPFIANSSPAQITITANPGDVITFYVQTVLANGMQSPITASPTATALVSTTKVTEQDLAFSLLSGMQIQPISSATINDTVAGSDLVTTLLNTTGDGTHIGGGLLTVGIQVVTSRTGDGAAPKISLDFTVDAQPTNSIILWDVGSSKFREDTTLICATLSGDGSTAGDYLKFNFNVGFQAHLVLTITVYHTDAGTPFVGQFDTSVLWCTKTT